MISTLEFDISVQLCQKLNIKVSTHTSKWNSTLGTFRDKCSRGKQFMIILNVYLANQFTNTEAANFYMILSVNGRSWTSQG